MPPRVIIIDPWIDGYDAFSAVVSCRAESSSFFRPPRRTRKARGTFLEPPHAVVRAPRADGTVDTTTLGLARLEGARIT